MGRQCYVCNSNHRVRGIKGIDYCNKHYLQIKRHGSTKRTKYDPNEITIKDTHAEVHLYDKNGVENCRALVSLDKVELIKNYKWYLNHDGYVIHKISDNKVIWMHRLISGADDRFEVDHKNRSRHDNRNENLRIATRSNNGMNSLEQSNNTSGFRGVVWHRASNKWMARIKLNQEEIYLGTYNNFEDAVKVRLDAEARYFGDFAPRGEVSSY